MSKNIELAAPDGHRLAAFLAEPTDRLRGGVVVIQEIFGVTRHIRAVAEQYAAAGYLAIAPALFDRIERDVDVPYTDLQRAFGYMKAVDREKAMLDLQAAIDRVGGAGKVGVVGYCWGGTLAYLAAARLKIDAAIAYYGGEIGQLLAEKPLVPILFHFGERDAYIPPDVVAQIKRAHPDGIYHSYPADHGFNCTDRASFEPKSAQLAFDRSVEFLRRNIG